MSDTTSVAVIGCGTMGTGIATAAAASGMAVVLYDIDADRARRVADRAARRAGGNTPEVRTSISGAVAEVDVVVETVPEVLELKATVLRAVHAHAKPDGLLSTNTSTMSIVTLENLAGCAGRLIGIHFFNPADKLRLVEIIRGPTTPQSTVDRAEAFAHALGKTPIVIRDLPGFVTSRLGLVLGNEAMGLLADGAATTTAIDTAMRLGYNHPMGPLELADLVGLDARLNNLRSLYAASGEQRFRPPPILVEMVRNDYLGRKNARGFYYYDAHGHKTGETAVVRPADPGD
ncbi:3-hydroxyacyl-CoA dehydrogenase family protein [Actinophytocola sediminis]